MLADSADAANSSEASEAPGRDLARLCQSCGLCCDGSLFGRVPLEPDEVPLARKNHLQVIESGRGFDQPCAALASVDEPVNQAAGSARTCRVYRDRPRACRRFVCRLYDRHRRDGGPIEPRLAAVRRVRELLDALDADAGPSSADRANHVVEELRARLDEDFARA